MSLQLAPCPTCGLAWSGSPQCRRCQTDLALVLAAAEQAAELTSGAEKALARGDRGTARALARRGLGLQRTAETLRAGALAALAERDFAAALALWREHRRGAQGAAQPEARG